jgi:hypothetical protein
MKLVQERAGNTLAAIGIGNDFFSRTQVAQQLRERIDKLDYMKLKSFCTAPAPVYNPGRLSGARPARSTGDIHEHTSNE